MAIADSLKVVQPSADYFLPWFKINETASVVALTMGLIIFIISYFAGGRENRNKLIISTILSVVITTFAVPLFLKFGNWTGLVKSQEGMIFLVLLIFIFLGGLACHIYEIVTVSAKEAHPPE